MAPHREGSFPDSPHHDQILDSPKSGVRDTPRVASTHSSFRPGESEEKPINQEQGPESPQELCVVETGSTTTSDRVTEGSQTTDELAGETPTTSKAKEASTRRRVLSEEADVGPREEEETEGEREETEWVCIDPVRTGSASSSSHPSGGLQPPGPTGSEHPRYVLDGNWRSE